MAEEEKETIYYFREDVYRHGLIEGFFISTPSKIEKVDGKEIYFGDVLGKHSGVEIEVNFKVISDDAKLVENVKNIFKTAMVSHFGYNPLDYCNEDEDESLKRKFKAETEEENNPKRLKTQDPLVQDPN